MTVPMTLARMEAMVRRKEQRKIAALADYKIAIRSWAAAMEELRKFRDKQREAGKNGKA